MSITFYDIAEAERLGLPGSGWYVVVGGARQGPMRKEKALDWAGADAGVELFLDPDRGEESALEAMLTADDDVRDFTRRALAAWPLAVEGR